MHRKQLIEYYQSADILFLHLNNYSAFNKVLPSKIFEYAACGKPIVAGLSGYAAKFLKNEIPYSVLFKPGNVQACVNALIHAHNMHVNSEQVDNFIAKFSRQTIMNKMASHILNIINGTVKKIPVLS